MNFLTKIFSKIGYQTRSSSDVEIDQLKDIILNQHKKGLAEIAKINKRFKIVIEKGELEVVIKNINDITNGK